MPQGWQDHPPVAFQLTGHSAGAVTHPRAVAHKTHLFHPVPECTSAGRSAAFAPTPKTCPGKSVGRRALPMSRTDRPQERDDPVTERTVTVVVAGAANLAVAAAK